MATRVAFGWDRILAAEMPNLQSEIQPSTSPIPLTSPPYWPEPTFTVCTSVAHRRLSTARVWAAALRRYAPSARLVVLVLDDMGRALPDSEQPFERLCPGQLKSAIEVWQELAFGCEPDEFAAAMTPFLLTQLREESKGPVVYLGPDVQVYSELDDIPALAEKMAIVLTPHLTIPLEADGSEVDEVTVLSAGVYDPDFIAVGEGSQDFLTWWSDREAHGSSVGSNHAPSLQRASQSDGTSLLVNRWLDLAPGYFDTHVLRDASLNVGHWNLGPRELTLRSDAYQVDGVPVRTFNFRGYDPFKPWLLTAQVASRPRVLLSERPALARLCGEYRTRLLEADYTQASEETYGFDSLSDGMPIIPSMRRCYRLGLVEREETRIPPPPERPFDPDGAEHMVAWFNSPGPDPAAPALTHYLHSVWRSRRDLLIAFPERPGSSAKAFLQWVDRYGRDELGIPDQLVPSFDGPRGPAFQRPVWKSSKGFNVSGYLAAGVGLGEAARAIVSAAKATGYPVTEFDSTSYWPSQWRFSAAPESAATAQPGAKAAHDFNIVCVNADWLPEFAKGMGKSFFASRVTAGVWFWETEELPQSLAGSADLVDEIWAGSRYTRDAIQRATNTPVMVVPIPVQTAPLQPGTTRAAAGMPEGYLFFFSFDMGSVTARKNPIGLVEAYTRAFAPGDGANLLIKTIRGTDSFRAELEELRMAVGGRPDISLIDGYLPVSQRDALMALCDCYVSLHRSEGLGLTMAEAMSRCKPVIATGYSGNMDFTDEENSYLVDYSLIPIGSGHEPYPASQRWADPDLEHAARLLRHVYENRAEAAEKGRRGAEVIARRYSIDACSRFLVERLSHANSWARLGWYRRQLISLRRRGVPRQLRDRAIAAGRTVW